MKSDPVLEAFSKICNESSFVFDRRRDGYFGFPISPSFVNTSAATAKEFENAIVADPDISKIFPDTSSAHNFSYKIYTSCGGSYSVQICLFAWALLRVSYMHMLLNKQCWADNIIQLLKTHSHHDRVCINHKYGNVIDLLLFSARHMLNVMRNAINGKENKVDFLLYFIGAGIDQEFNHGNGTFIPFHAGIKCIIPEKFYPIQYCNVENAGFIYKVTIDYKIKIGCSEENGMLFWQEENYNNKFINDIVEVMPFACTMCSRKDRPISVHYERPICIDPFACSVELSYTRPRYNVLYPEILNRKELKNLSSWIEKISGTDDSKIEIAKRRLYSALLLKNNIEDSFIDCIIGLESLFGQRSEISFTLATCVSKLLYCGVECREEKFDEIKRLYNIRSKILHDGKIIEHKEMKEYRDKALELLTACLRKLYEDRSGLIKMKIPDRVKKIALQ